MNVYAVCALRLILLQAIREAWPEAMPRVSLEMIPVRLGQRPVVIAKCVAWHSAPLSSMGWRTEMPHSSDTQFTFYANKSSVAESNITAAPSMAASGTSVSCEVYTNMKLTPIVVTGTVRIVYLENVSVSLVSEHFCQMELRCEAQAAPAAQYSWSHGLGQGQTASVRASSAPKNYTCTAHNAAGSGSATATVSCVLMNDAALTVVAVAVMVTLVVCYGYVVVKKALECLRARRRSTSRGASLLW
ncbi:putative immunoglobulin-like domain containing protein [Namao virus]|nr:putative immunoglobulin-like domain containing protein [Namao virus]